MLFESYSVSKFLFVVSRLVTWTCAIITVLDCVLFFWQRIRYLFSVLYDVILYDSTIVFSLSLNRHDNHRQFYWFVWNFVLLKYVYHCILIFRNMFTANACCLYKSFLCWLVEICYVLIYYVRIYNTNLLLFISLHLLVMESDCNMPGFVNVQLWLDCTLVWILFVAVWQY